MQSQKALMCLTLAAVCLGAFPCASAYGWGVADTGANTSWFVTWTDTRDDDGGYGYTSQTSAGSNGVYVATATCITGYKADFWGVYWYNSATGLGTLDGWRQKTITHCNTTDTASYNWAVDLGVEMSGRFDMDNGLAPIVYPLGDCEAIGDAYVILTGMGSALGNAKGTVTGEEGCGKADLSVGAIGIDLPLDLPGDSTSFYGDGAAGQTLSSSGTKPNAVKGNHIRIRGFVKVNAKCNDAALKSTITCKTTLPTFTLTKN